MERAEPRYDPAPTLSRLSFETFLAPTDSRWVCRLAHFPKLNPIGKGLAVSIAVRLWEGIGSS